MFFSPRRIRSRQPLSLFRGMTMIALGSVILAAAGNALSPAGIAWHHDGSREAWHRVVVAGYKPLSVSETVAFVRRSSPFIVDARDPASYERGHLPNAVTVPWQVAREFLEANGAKIPSDTPLLVYCSSAQCEAALVLSDFFRARGFRDISVLVDGFDSWQAAGGPVAGGFGDE